MLLLPVVVNQIRVIINWQLIIDMGPLITHQNAMRPSSLHLFSESHYLFSGKLISATATNKSFLCIYIVSLQEVLLTDKRGNLCPGRYPVYVENLLLRSTRSNNSGGGTADIFTKQFAENDRKIF